MADGLHVGTGLDGGELRLDPGDLTTHAVIVGMTGSGKTGLGIVLLEEALLQGIPALILDPKGDMGNLALTFPDLSAASFRPWIDDSTARDAGVSADEYAERTAALWQKGLAEHGLGRERIEALRAAAEVTLYTPGSEAGVPLNVIGSLKAPTLSWESEEETLRDEIEGTVSSLLGLVGIDADPIASREHVLLANLLEHSWRAGRDLDLGTLIAQIQTAAAPEARRLRRRRVPAAEGAKRAGGAAERPDRVARLRCVGSRASARSQTAPDRRGRQAAGGGHLPRAPVRTGAPVRGDADPLALRHLDARPLRHERPARARLLRRGLRLRTADGDAARRRSRS